MHARDKVLYSADIYIVHADMTRGALMLHSGSRPVTRGALTWSACWQTLTETPCHGLTRHAADTVSVDKNYT